LVAAPDVDAVRVTDAPETEAVTGRSLAPLMALAIALATELAVLDEP
jgi:hypothetical protein